MAGNTVRRTGFSRTRSVSGFASTIVLVMVAVLAISTLGAEPAHADCVAPSLSSSATTVTRGEVITIEGRAWGSQCNDVNPKPDAPVLGPPATGIKLSILQDGRETVVARGDATDDYTFSVDVEAPETLKPGEATVVATRNARPVELSITDAPPVRSTSASVVPFGPANTTDTPPGSATPGAPDAGGGSTAVWWVIGGFAAMAVLTVVFAFRRIRSKTERRSS